MGTRRLLVLDDDLAVCQTIASIAESAGMNVRITTDHHEFFREVHAWDPTHIALDLVMPEVDGVQVIEMLAAKQCDASLIITSGVGQRVLDAARRSATEHGLHTAGVLSKPFPPQKLRRLLASPANLSAIPELHESAGATAAHAVTFTKAELEHGIANQELQVYFQPKLDLATERLAGFEALVRWMHPAQGVVMPDRFVGVAEEHGLIDLLTQRVFENALGWFADNFSGPYGGVFDPLPESLVSRLGLSMNISAKSLRDRSFVEGLLSACTRRGLDPARFIFELTETSAMENPTMSLDLLTRLRMKGFHLSIDDFGTGYSSMLQLVRLPFSEIKVDKTFVMTAMKSQESRSVIKSIVDLGHSLEMKATAEGVEDQATMDYLRDIGCDLAQGYFIGRPMRGDLVLQWIRERFIGE